MNKPISHWRYGIGATKTQGVKEYSLIEVYFTGKKKPVAFTEAFFTFESKKAMELGLKRIKKALKEGPIYDKKRFPRVFR